MRINIIGCGESGRHWDGSGDSIGVNDMLKFGHHPDNLLILNTPNQFSYERLVHIKQTRTNKIYTNTPSAWSKILIPSLVERIDSRQWNNTRKHEKVSKNYLYHSKTSPFAAISLAYQWGYNDIVLYGVDFSTHRRYKPGNVAFKHEFNSYKTFCEALNKVGVTVYRITDESNLTFLPIWQK